MNESRLFRMVYYILEKGKVRATDLAEYLEVSVRTIYRDVDAISSAGFPIYVTTGRNGGIQFQDHFVLNKTILSREEKQEVLNALQSVNVINRESVDATLSKLTALFKLPNENWYEVDFSRWGKQETDHDKFEIIKEAIIQTKALQIRYVNSNGNTTLRSIHPLKLLYKDKAWYVKAYCTIKEAFRTFKFNRIIDAVCLLENFTPIPYEDTQLQESRYNTIVLRFEKEVAYRVYDEFDASQVKGQDEKCIVVEAKMPEDIWLIGYLLSFGNQVEVLEPLYLRDQLALEAKKIYEKNKP